MEDVVNVSKNICRNQTFLPIFLLSNTTCNGITLLLNFLNQIPLHDDPFFESVENEPSIINISDTHEVKGQVIVSGLVQSGVVKKKQKMFLGPNSKGEFKEAEIKSI